MDVIDMNEFRKNHPTTPEGSGYDGAVCRRCGEAWFRLSGDPALVCVSTDGSVTGYAGRLHCSSCGSEFR